MSPTLPPTGTVPIIRPWGTGDSGKRNEAEPVARFRVLRDINSAEIKFDPPMYFSHLLLVAYISTGRYILMKLYNNLSGEPFERAHTDRPIERRGPQSRPTTNSFRDETSPDQMEVVPMWEMEEGDDAFGETQESEVDFENVDVQAILFYGHTGRRCFPSIKAL
jgi:hypothetical protein